MKTVSKKTTEATKTRKAAGTSKYNQRDVTRLIRWLDSEREALNGVTKAMSYGKPMTRQERLAYFMFLRVLIHHTLKVLRQKPKKSYQGFDEM